MVEDSPGVVNLITSASAAVMAVQVRGVDIQSGS